MTIEIVDLPIDSMVIFPSVFCMFTRSGIWCNRMAIFGVPHCCPLQAQHLQLLRLPPRSHQQRRAVNLAAAGTEQHTWQRYAGLW